MDELTRRRHEHELVAGTQPGAQNGAPGSDKQMPIKLRQAASAVVGLAAMAGAAHAEDAGSLSEAIAGGKLILELRPRVEHVDQTGIADADAFTNRTRLGWETASWRGLKGLIEFEDVRRLSGDYNDGVPPAEPFASISDPESTELNRLQFTWQANPHFTAILGRQNVQFDDQRFIDSSNSRQDSRTYDAARADLTFGSLKASYVYLGHVNNTVSDATDLDTESHLLNLTQTYSDALKLTGFVYAFDFTTPAAINQSSQFFGVRAAGRIEMQGARFDYAASYANQQDYGSSTIDFGLDYWLASLTGSRGHWSGRAQYESLEGDGARGLFFPLGSSTNFHGWANAFGAKPADGLIDLNFSATYSPDWSAPYLRGIAFTARWYEFEAHRTGADLGNELDLEIAAELTPHISLQFRQGEYQSGDAGSPAERRRTWLALEYKR